MIGRRLVATALAFSVAGIPMPARVTALAVLTQADHAHVSGSPASAGTTIYDGDLLSTDNSGVLRLHTKSAMLYLAGQSNIVLHNAEKGVQAQLAGGTAVFSSVHAAAIEIHADEARIRPVADVPTIAQISIIGPKELSISARRGSLEFSYHDDSEVIPEGASYRVVLDPPNDQGPYAPGKDQPVKKPSRRRKAFMFILIGGGAALGGWLIHELIESPDEP
jgi:hypothetical protein